MMKQHANQLTRLIAMRRTHPKHDKTINLTINKIMTNFSTKKLNLTNHTSLIAIFSTTTKNKKIIYSVQ